MATSRGERALDTWWPRRRPRCLLAILPKGPSQGRIIRSVRTLSGGELEWSEGMLYPVLDDSSARGRVAAVGRRERGPDQGMEERVKDEDSALAAALSAGTLALAMLQILPLRFRAGGLMFEVGAYAMIASGALAAAAAAVESWRTAGSRFGSRRALNS